MFLRISVVFPGRGRGLSVADATRNRQRGRHAAYRLLPCLWLWILSACANPSAPEAEASSLRPEYAALQAELPSLPTYDIQTWFRPERNQLAGEMRVRGRNDSPDTWHQLVFRLYPNLYHYGGNMVIERGALGNTIVPFRLEADDSAAVFLLAREDWIAPDQAFDFRLRWRLSFPILRDVSSIYVRFGEILGFHAAPNFYPALAPYLPGPIPGAGAWWVEEGPSHGDVAFSRASLFSVSLYMPAGFPPVTNGVLVAQRALEHACPHLTPWTPCTLERQNECLERLTVADCRAQNLVRYRFASGPVREFAFITHPDYESVSFDVNGVLVTSYWVPAYAASGRAARDYAVAALRIYAAEFGPYPYRFLTVAMAPLANGSMEYPQLNLVGLQLYQGFEASLETQIAFSVAHQWWYQLVHNDPVNEPWLDEALSSFAAYLYQERLYGADRAALYRLQEWVVPVQYMKDNAWDAPVNRSVHAYPTERDYEILVYRKGALLLDLVRTSIGPRAMRLLLTDIVAKHRFGLIDSTALLDYLWRADPTVMTLHQKEYLTPELWR